MKKQIYIILVAATAISSCKKTELPQNPAVHYNIPQQESFPLSLARSWQQSQDSSISKLKANWNQAKKLETKNAWLIPIPGSPIFQKVKQGYRKLLIKKDSSESLSARILEIIPDAYTLQEFGDMEKGKFSGRILVYTPDHQLESGKLFSSGKATGEIIQAKLSPKKLMSLKQQYSNPKVSYTTVQQGIYAFETCSWYDSSYIDADGIFTVHSERICSYRIYREPNNFDDDNPDTYTDDNPSPGGAGTGASPVTSPATNIPESSNLPGEENPTVDPKKMMDCFSAIASNPNAAFQVKIHVQEPFPGTSFNIGPNSVGHVAIELTVTSGGQSITQVVGFYPQGTKGTDRASGPSRLVNNSRFEYNVSATFYVNQGNFQNITNFISNAPQGYNFLTYNCTSFVYTAATLGGIDIPMGYTTVGLTGPGGATSAQTPAGMGSELRAMKANNPYLNISTGGGRARASKGECQ